MVYRGLIHLFIMIIQLSMSHMMATPRAPSYTSHFEYTPEHHPSLNPNCPTAGSRRARKSAGDKYFITTSHKNNDEDMRRNTESSVEMMATLLPCPHAHNRPINNSNTTFSKFHWRRRRSRVEKCHRKLVINIKLTNVGKIATDDQYIVIDHVTDSVTMQKFWLIDPYLVKLRQEQVLQLYGLDFESVVNAEATEEVINNKNEGFQGCDDYSQHPTCGQMYYKGMKIPYSQGFCCSCPEETDSTSSAHQNEAVSSVRPQFYRKRFTDGTKSIEKLLEDLQSHRRYSTISPRHFEAKKYLEISTRRSNSEKEDLPKGNNRSFGVSPGYVSTNKLFGNASTKNNNLRMKFKRRLLKNKRENLSGLSRQRRYHINRRKWSKNYANRLSKMLMKNHFAPGKNNEKDVGDNEYSAIALHVASSTYISPVMRDFFQSNTCTTTEMKLLDVDVEKTPALNWKIPIELGHSFISPNEDLRDVEMQLQSLSNITKKVETTISPVSAKPKIIIERFKITKGGRVKQEPFLHRKLLNYSGKRTVENLFTGDENKGVANGGNVAPQDFAISLTGKIHIDSGGGGGGGRRPVSITFDTSPGGANSNDPLEQSAGPLKVNRRSVGSMGIPYEIIPKRVKQHKERRTSNKITGSDYSKTLQILEKNLISNELPNQMDQNDLQTATTNPGKIKPYSLSGNGESFFPSPYYSITTKSPENFLKLSDVVKPVNLKIIGLISMSNPGNDKIEENSQKNWDKGWLGDFEIGPLIHVKVEKQSSSTQSPETNEKTTAKPSSCFTTTTVGQTTTGHSISTYFTSNTNTKSSDDIPETVTFYVDSGDEESTTRSSEERSTVEIIMLKNETTNVEKNQFSVGNHDNCDYGKNETKETTTPIVESPRDDYPHNEPDTRLNNMLAIMEFIKKLKSILTNDESCSNERQPGSVIRLQKFVITPENSTAVVQKLPDETTNERYVNTQDNSLSGIPRQRPQTNFNSSNESPKQTYITRIIKRPENVDVEALREKLIDQYAKKREKDTGELENRALEISRELASLNSKDAFENNRQVRSRKIVNSAARLERKEVAKKDKQRNRKKKNRRRKKKKKKKSRRKFRKGKIHENRQEAKGRNEKTWWPFKRQLMSLTVKNVPSEEIYYDEIEDKQWEIENLRRRRASNKNHRNNIFPRKNSDFEVRERRQINASLHIRGGQNCMDHRHPPNVDPAKYLESGHCLRFSDLWYSVYKLGKPVVEHTVYVQLFKRERDGEEANKSRWRDLTRGEMIRLGTFTRHQRDRVPTIVFTYTAEKHNDKIFSLDPANQRLLIPLIEKNGKYSEGMREYLIIPSNEITREGRECDKAGVGFSAFVMQKDRCTRKPGSCLRNQPLSYWRHDMHARESGQPGCYFLSNFATVPVNPIKYNVTDVLEKQKYLGLVQNTHHVSTLEIEVRADDNNIIAIGPPGRITEVHTDATARERTRLSIRLTNTGLVSSDYQARIVGCPSGLPSSWANAITPKQTVPPQHDSLLTLNLVGRVIIDSFNCTVEVINYRGELVAARRIIVHKMNRCFCLWHCICTCYQSPRGFSCSPMTPEYYHRAGFRGPVPAINTRHSEFHKIAIDLFLIVLLLLSLLLILGILKWLLGIIFPRTSRLGLDSLVSAARFKIDEYAEPELKCRCVVTDDEGIPIHPDTARRTVRLCSRAQEFFINSFFFFLYPSCLLCDCVRRICKCRREKCHCDDDSKDSLLDKETRRVISVRSYGDMRNSKLERQDTEYVITQLKKSQVSLGH